MTLNYYYLILMMEILTYYHVVVSCIDNKALAIYSVLVIESVKIITV